LDSAASCASASQLSKRPLLDGLLVLAYDFSYAIFVAKKPVGFSGDRWLSCKLKNTSRINACDK